MDEDFRNDSFVVAERFFRRHDVNMKLNQSLKEVKGNEGKDFGVSWSNTDDSDDVDGTCISDPRF
jgi:hypothetical protein